MSAKNFQRSFQKTQTHFIGVLVPDDLTHTLEDCRRYMNENFGCKSGYGTPVHVTLVPPFKLPEPYTTKDIADAIKADVLFDSALLCFSACVKNFDAFGDRTIFAKVEADEKWTKLRDAVFSAVLKAAPESVRKDKRPFQPHLTVANRDIPPGSSAKALETMNELNLFTSFKVDNITIFERNGGKWIPKVSLEAGE